MERNLLTGARMDRMVDAPTAADAAKVLQEIGYGDFSPDSQASLGQALAQERDKTFQELYQFVPDQSVVDVFRVKYDYHNIKTLLKARATGQDPSPLLVEAGRVEVRRLREAVEEGKLDLLPPLMAQAAAQAGEVLSATGDPQRSDFVLDDAYFREMLQAAEETGSQFLTGYVRTTIDAANLRSAVRTLRMGRGADFLRRVLFSGGTVPEDRILAAASGGSLEELYRGTPLRAAAEAGKDAIAGGSLTAFEKACDDAVTATVAAAKSVAFGVEVVIAYLVAKEIEFTAVRIIMSGRMAGIDGEKIRERLRESYV